VGERDSKGVGRVEGKEVLTKGFSLSEESELVDMAGFGFGGGVEVWDG